MEMSRTLTGVLAACLVLAMAAVAGAGIPNADESFVTMTANGKGLTTCPAGDVPAYGYITVTARDADAFPIQGITSGDFFITVTGTGSGNVSISAFDTETDANGEIRFEASQDGGIILYGSLTIEVRIYTTVLTDSDLLWCNTYDYNDDGVVNPVDFVLFASDFLPNYHEKSDFNWNGVVDPVDFVLFASHWLHTTP